MNKKRQIAIVTGATRGLGKGCVDLLLSKGFEVWALGRDPKKIEEGLNPAQKEHLKIFSVDVSSMASLDTFAAELEKFSRDSKGSAPYILINNAGIFLDDMNALQPLATSAEDLEKTLRTNVLGPYRLCQIVLPYMRKAGAGRIVNVSSGMGQLSEMGTTSPAYRISKTALNSLTRHLAREVQDCNVLVNSVCPGWVRTDMGGPQATRELSEGVASIVWAAMLPEDGPSGGFFRDGKPLSW